MPVNFIVLATVSVNAGYLLVVRRGTSFAVLHRETPVAQIHFGSRRSGLRARKLAPATPPPIAFGLTKPAELNVEVVKSSSRNVRDRHDCLTGRIGAAPCRARLTTQPTFTFGNPVEVPIGRLQITEGLGLNAPRRFDIGPDGAIIGTVDAEQTPSEALAAPRIEVVLNWFEELKARVPTP